MDRSPELDHPKPRTLSHKGRNGAINDRIPYIAWYDYASAVGALPIEALVLQAWYFAKYPAKLADGMSGDPYTELIPGLKPKDRSTQNLKLRRVIEWTKTQLNVMDHLKTGTRPLLT